MQQFEARVVGADLAGNGFGIYVVVAERVGLAADGADLFGELGGGILDRDCYWSERHGDVLREEVERVSIISHICALTVIGRNENG